MTGTITVFLHRPGIRGEAASHECFFFLPKERGALMKNMTRQKSKRRTLENAKTLFVR